MENTIRKVLTITISLFLLLTIVLLNQQTHSYHIKKIEDFYYLPIGKYAKLISFGYNNVMADILWMKTLAYTGEHIVSDRDFRYLVSLIDAITDLDPYFYYPYRFAGTILPWEVHDPKDAIRILRKGIRYLPNEWHLWFLTGFTYLYFLNNYRKAAYYMAEAAKKPGRPLFIVSLASKLLAKENDPDTAIRILMAVYKNTRNKTVQKRILKKIKMIIAEKNFRLLERAVKEYFQKYKQYPSSLGELVKKGIIKEIPIEPFGGKYYITPDGKVRSTVYNKRIKIYLKK